MPQKILALLGLLLLTIAIFLGAVIFRQTQQAKWLDGIVIPENIVVRRTLGYPSSFDLLPICNISITETTVSRRRMAENDSQALTVYLSNDKGESCEAVVSIQAPNFDISPLESTLSVKVPLGERTASVIWIIVPRKSGTFDIAVTVRQKFEEITTGIQDSNFYSSRQPRSGSPNSGAFNYSDSQPDISYSWISSPIINTGGINASSLNLNKIQTTATVGVTVTNTMGLSPQVATILTWLAGFLGPLLTAPWWYERWKEQQQKKEKEDKKLDEPEDEQGKSINSKDEAEED